ncbi:MAG: DUF2786 domain-containing protein [Cyanobacteria bacterium P01_H01_bin.15]
MSASPPVIQKIQKLLRLASCEAANENEAAAAAQKAQGLLLAHNLTLEAVWAENSKFFGENPIGEYCLERGHRRKVKWKAILLAAIAKANGCYEFSRGPMLYVVGPETSVEVCALTYEYLASIIVRVAKAEPPDRSWRNAFRLGAARRLGERLVQQRYQWEQDGLETVHQPALVVRSHYNQLEQAVADFLQYVYGEREFSLDRSPQYSNVSGYVAGRSAAETVNLNIEAGSETSMLERTVASANS